MKKHQMAAIDIVWNESLSYHHSYQLGAQT